MIFLNGIFRNAPEPLCYALYLIWIELILFFLTTTMSQYIYRYCIFCRNGAMSLPLFWSLISINIFLNALHGFSLIWADYPRMEDIEKMALLTALVKRESGIFDYRIIAFVKAVTFCFSEILLFWIVVLTFSLLWLFFNRLGKTSLDNKGGKSIFPQTLYV